MFYGIENTEEVKPSKLIKEQKYYNEKVKDPIKTKYNKLTTKMNKIIEIVESEDFKKLDLSIKENNDFAEMLKQEIKKIIIEMNDLKNTLKNTRDITNKQEQLNEEETKQIQYNVFIENYKIYKKFKETKSDIPEVFSYIFTIYDKVENIENLEDKFNKFIILYNDNYDFLRDIEKDFFNVFLYEKHKI